MLVDKTHIYTVLPQRNPFIMIDNLLVYQENYCKTNLIIESRNLFCQNGLFVESGLIENIAQTGAAHAGYESILSGIPVKVGFIGAIKNLKIYNLPEIGDVIENELHVVNKLLNVTINQGIITCKGSIIAESEIKVFLQN